MEEYLEKVITQKVKLQEANKFLMGVVAHLVRDFDLPWEFSAAQLTAAAPINITSEDGMVFEIVAQDE